MQNTTEPLKNTHKQVLYTVPSVRNFDVLTIQLDKRQNKTVFILKVITDISWFERATPGYHFYVGNDTCYFRYPDEKLLLKGNVFSCT